MTKQALLGNELKYTFADALRPTKLKFIVFLRAQRPSFYLKVQLKNKLKLLY